VPTLVLSGGDSPAALRKAGEAVDGALPDSRIVVMTGHGHAAMDTGTDLFTTEVLRFAEGPSQKVVRHKLPRPPRRPYSPKCLEVDAFSEVR
jgi:hypothetical protein